MPERAEEPLFQSRRAVQTSLLPDLQRDKPIGPILGSVFTGTNADLMAAVAPYYLTGSVLDVTYGNGERAGGWWRRFTPDPFTFHDLALDGVDFRALPHTDREFDTVCYDPPYVRSGGPAAGTASKHFREAYGLDARRSTAELDALIRDGLTETARVTRRWLLVKCTDYVDSTRLKFGHLDVIGWAESLGLGRPHDLIVHSGIGGPVGHNIYTPKRARRRHSYLLVFRKVQQ